MGYNTTLLLAEMETPAALRRALPRGYRDTGLVIDWEQASSSALGRGVAIGGLPGLGVMWTPDIEIALSRGVLGAASRAGRAFSFVLGSVSDVYGFAVYGDGKEVRLLLRAEGVTAHEAGRRLPEEAGLEWDDPEDAVFDLALRLTGLEAARHEAWSGVEFVVWTPGE